MKVLIADDHAVLREGIKTVVKTLSFVSDIEEAADGTQAMSKIKDNDYDLVILDISMPGTSGLDILRNIRNSGLRCRALILSFHPDEQYAARVFKLGAVGYVSKSAPFDEVKKAISKVAHGGRYVSPGFAEKLAFDNDQFQLPHERLSEREFQVMLLLAEGKSVSEIARQVFISDKTVSTYRRRIMKKMDMKTNADLTIYAINNGLIA